MAYVGSYIVCILSLQYCVVTLDKRGTQHYTMYMYAPLLSHCKPGCNLEPACTLKALDAADLDERPR